MKMEEKKRDFWIGDNHTYLDADNILNAIIAGEWNENTAIAVREAALKFINMVDGKVDFLVDLDKAGKQSPETRKGARKLIEHEKIGKVAIFGLHPVARVLASFIMGVTKKEDMRFFKTKEEALAWLKE